MNDSNAELFLFLLFVQDEVQSVVKDVRSNLMLVLADSFVSYLGSFVLVCVTTTKEAFAGLPGEVPLKLWACRPLLIDAKRFFGRWLQLVFSFPAIIAAL